MVSLYVTLIIAAIYGNIPFFSIVLKDSNIKSMFHFLVVKEGVLYFNMKNNLLHT